MKDSLIRIRNRIIEFLYCNILKQVFFKFDAEKVHNGMIQMGRFLGNNFLLKKIVSFSFNFSSPMLKQKICGIEFKNPIGLAGGFDKDAKIIEILPSVGFGFNEIGSITGEPYAGNPKPRLWRLIKSNGIVINYGLKSEGCEAIAKKLSRYEQGQVSKIPLGVNVAKTNSPDTIDPEKGIQDYLKVLRSFLYIGDYFTINISCPNSYDSQPFTNPPLLNLLLQEISKLGIKKPMFLKLSPDLPHEQIDRIIELADQYKLSGFICSNLTKDRDNPKIIPEEISPVPEDTGSISGEPVEEMTNDLIAYIYQKTEGRKVIIGCGGVFSAEDAYKKIKRGASLVQLITGMIFKGPQVISQINLGLCDLFRKDGFGNIEEAIGSKFK
jgi:dihydroorotate dehydrogenase